MKTTNNMKPTAPQIVCANGVRLSVQASRVHYSTPRNDEGPYTTMEVGYITHHDGSSLRMPMDWWKYADDPGMAAMSGVYAYVPIGLIEEFISSQGGRASTRNH